VSENGNPSGDEDGGPAVDAAGGPHVSTITSREEAYQKLAEIADYLFRTEPHSPVPYLVHRAITWGQMPLDQLLPELTRGRGDLSLFMELLGMQETRQSKESR
jgi:hypothetical protein